MKAQVRFISTNDGEDFEDVVLEDPDDVDIWITVMAGPVGGPGEESFQLRVRSPLSITRELNQWGPLHERHIGSHQFDHSSSSQPAQSRTRTRQRLVDDRATVRHRTRGYCPCPVADRLSGVESALQRPHHLERAALGKAERTSTSGVDETVTSVEPPSRRGVLVHVQPQALSASVRPR